MNASPFHPGELQAQVCAGGGAQGAGIRDHMTQQHRSFFASLPFVAVGSIDRDWPVAMLITGAPGFLSTPDPHTLRIAAATSLQQGAPVGVLGIEFGTRRRNRANGVVTAATPEVVVIDVEQSFGNCPQYIRPRPVERVPDAAPIVERFEGLDPLARAMVEAADTLFVASAAYGGVDISHRGGPTGFLRVDGQVISIPDYQGNRYFNTLGNLVAQPRAALLFADFETGALLHLQGTTTIVWDGPTVGEFPGAERVWQLTVDRGWRRRPAGVSASA